MENWNEAVPLPEEDAELLKIRKDLKKRNWKTVLTSLLLAAIMLFVSVYGIVPAVESLYWGPYDSGYSASQDTSDLKLVLQTHSELFQPGYGVGFIAHRTGFASYELNITRTDVATGEKEYMEGTLKRGKLSLDYSFWNLQTSMLSQRYFYRGRYSTPIRPVIASDLERTQKLLTELPSYVSLKAAVSFPEDLTMKQLMQSYLDYNYNSEDGITLHWVGVRNNNDDSDRSIPMCGFSLNYGGNGYGINEVYPELNSESFSVDGTHWEQHFKSLLEFSRDQAQKEKGISYFIGNENFYQYVLDYIAENGIMTYGVMVTGTPEGLLGMLDSGLASEIVLLDGWIDVG